MIINGFKAGQLGNRLFHASQLIVLSIETGSSYVDFAFDDYKENFEGLYNRPFLLYPQSNPSALRYKLLGKVWQKLDHIRDFTIHRKISNRYWAYINQNGLVMDDYNDLVEQRRKYKNYMVEGWISKDTTPLLKYRELLANIFKPRQQHLHNIENLIKKGKDGVDILMGIHIRRGDYKEYRGGIFYYDDNVYLNIMENMQKAFPEKKIRFLICSNEEVNWNNYAAYDVMPSNNQIIEDMYALSYCDYIAGPISTYSMWASFIRQKPLYQILRKDLPFDLNHFRVIKDRSE